ncbi:repressor of galETK operon [Fimbriimonas ginsengisoli Gsoil 348]|uniref:Repressor of galETK operon n=2 Tax=Fimbriimonas ginsengisoli TaxID=1005039 RepID=A0A068NVP6_FIMGI|nr:repressor of galETK operon [Fimbriimonas ginsengisoli Gsoil 348]
MTLRDVARSIGVSESTVSVVLNGTRSGTRVSATTRLSVIQAAEKLGYRPNAQARSLLTGRTNRIGIYSGRSRLTASGTFFADLLGGIFEGSGEVGMNTVVHTSGSEPDKLLDLVSDRAIDGLIIHARADDPIVPMLDELKVPTVAVVDAIDFLPSVTADDVSGGQMQARHLASRGHRHVLYKQTAATAQSAITRMEAFVESASAHGIRVTVHEGLDNVSPLTDRDLQVLTDGDNRATALVGWNDWQAWAACAVLRERGMSIPGEVAVIGFDGFEFRDFNITSIRAPWREVGGTAVSILSRLLSGDAVPALTNLPVEFVRGETT